MLSHDAIMSDANLFAATIILRVWEEMEGKATPLVSKHSLMEDMLTPPAPQ